MDTKNTISDYLINALVVSFWIAIIGAVYNNPPEKLAELVPALIVVIIFYWFTVHPFVKMLCGTATASDLMAITFFPGFGLRKRKWMAYQRIVRKFANEEAIQGCENALKIMENSFEAGWEQFREWFPRIEMSGETCKKRYKLMGSAIYKQIKQKRINLEEGFRTTTEGIKSGLLLQYEDVAEFLKQEEGGKAARPHCDISEKAFEKQFEFTTSYLRDLQKELTEGNSMDVFHKLEKFIPEE